MDKNVGYTFKKNSQIFLKIKKNLSGDHFVFYNMEICGQFPAENDIDNYYKTFHCSIPAGFLSSVHNYISLMTENLTAKWKLCTS